MDGKLLMDFCRTMVAIKDLQDDKKLDGAGDGAYNNAAVWAKAVETIKADWDSDEDSEFLSCYPHLNEIDQLLHLQYLLNLEQCKN